MQLLFMNIQFFYIILSLLSFYIICFIIPYINNRLKNKHILTYINIYNIYYIYRYLYTDYKLHNNAYKCIYPFRMHFFEYKLSIIYVDLAQLLYL